MHLVHLANWILGFWIFGSSWIYFTVQRTRKHFIETKIFIKIPIVFKTLFQSVRERVQSGKKNLRCIRKKFKLCERKIFS